MSRKFAAVCVGLVATLLVACGGRNAGGMASNGALALPPLERDLTVSAMLPARTVGEEQPSEGLGSIKMASWHATVGGFTQRTYSQTLAFPPGTKITIRNLSKTTPHTFNVIKKIDGHVAAFPKNPQLVTSARGNGKLGIGYASGIIEPGKAVSVILANPGTYLIGCAFHYQLGMRDVLVVSKNAKPGPQATPPASSPSPSPTSSGGGGGGW
jgi:plastocyanin